MTTMMGCAVTHKQWRVWARCLWRDDDYIVGIATDVLEESVACPARSHDDNRFLRHGKDSEMIDLESRRV